MKKYRSHKVVEAAKISKRMSTEGAKISMHERLDGPVLLAFEDELPRLVSVQDRFPEGCEGGYYIKFEDGHESWLSAEAFEKEYVEIPEDQDAANRQAKIYGTAWLPIQG